jgi:hypothetical protein
MVELHIHSPDTPSGMVCNQAQGATLSSCTFVHTYFLLSIAAKLPTNRFEVKYHVIGIVLSTVIVAILLLFCLI